MPIDALDDEVYLSAMTATVDAVRGPRRLLTQRQQERDLITSAFLEVARPGQPLRVLEAGCGQKWSVKLPDVEIDLTGVDYDAEALRLRLEVQQDLDAAILGDLRTVDLPADAFDVAYCAFVLEHVEGAEQVLDHLVDAVQPGGRLVLLVPDGQSVVGWAAKTFPLWVAVLYKKHIEGFKDAGKPGHAPYPTVYDPVVSLDGMRDYAARHHLRIVEEYGIDYVLKNFRRFRPIAERVLRAVSAMTGGRLAATHNNLGFVLEKPLQHS
jgi:SAM-dependent methyltransferase